MDGQPRAEHPMASTTAQTPACFWQLRALEVPVFSLFFGPHKHPWAPQPKGPAPHCSAAPTPALSLSFCPCMRLSLCQRPESQLLQCLDDWVPLRLSEHPFVLSSVKWAQ